MTKTVFRTKHQESDAITRASLQERRAAEAGRRARRAAVERRRALRVIDSLLPALEDINQSGRGSDTEVLSKAGLDEIAVALGRSLPEYVRSAETPAMLHGALLDWQEELLNDAAPQRWSYREVDLEIDPPSTRRRRRRVSGQPLREAA